MPVDVAAPIHLSVTSTSEAELADLETQMRQMKKELKEWERSFAEREGRKPEKQDITANKEIARRYKSYMKLKSSVDSGAASAPTAPATKAPKASVKTRPSKSQAVAAAREGSPPDTNEDAAYETPTVPATSKPKPPAAARKVARAAVRKTTAPRAQAADSVSDPRNDAKENDMQVEDMDEDIPPIRSSGVKATFLDKSAITAAATAGSDENKGNPNDSSQGASGNLGSGESRPWGANAALPNNFNLRRNTVAVGPISTATFSSTPPSQPVSRPGTAGGERRATIGEGSASTTIDKMEAFDDNPEASEFMDFMNRRKEIEEITASATPPPGTVTAAEALRNMKLRPQSPADGGIRPPPIVTSITVQQQQSTQSPHSAYAPTTDAPPPLSPMTLSTPVTRVLSPIQTRSIEVNDDIEEIEATSDTPVHAFGQRISAASPVSSTTPVPPKRTSITKGVPLPQPPAQNLKPRKGQHQSEVQDINDDDDNEGDNRETISPMAITQLTPANSKFNADAIGSATNPIMTQVRPFFRVTKDHILRCKLYRKKNILDKSHPTFFLYNQADDSFILAARKRKKSKSVNFVISTSQVDMSKDSKHYIAKLKANFQRTNFLLLDARSYNPRASNKGLRELACVSYSKTVLPREMSIVIPATHIEELSDENSTDIMADIKTQNTNKLFFMRNKPPRWNDVTQSHCLNFGGRVTQPSIKNFQLIGSDNDNFVTMQFGRCGADYFTLDVRWPMTPLEAFAVALSTFDAYDNA
ncbi:Tub family-domain-containing protein [Phlyctochytrium arcticum]|nr:Tub family-domain-containing protein [Phlyctochytrium arcticum]